MCGPDPVKTKIKLNDIYRFSSYRAVSKCTPSSVTKKNFQLMPSMEIIVVCSQIHTLHINTICGQNVQKVITRLQRVKKKQEIGENRNM